MVKLVHLKVNLGFNTSMEEKNGCNKKVGRDWYALQQLIVILMLFLYKQTVQYTIE